MFSRRVHYHQRRFHRRSAQDWSPLGADRFYNLVKNGFFNHAHFFRVVPGFVVQFGLSPIPAVNKAWKTPTFRTIQSHRPTPRISYVCDGWANTRTTQLFINLGENARLDKMGFSPFGNVIEGMDVVEKLYTGYGEAPDRGKSRRRERRTWIRIFRCSIASKVARLEGVTASAPAAKKTTPPPAKTSTAPAKN